MTCFITWLKAEFVTLVSLKVPSGCCCSLMLLSLVSLLLSLWLSVHIAIAFIFAAFAVAVAIDVVIAAAAVAAAAAVVVAVAVLPIPPTPHLPPTDWPPTTSPTQAVCTSSEQTLSAHSRVQSEIRSASLVDATTEEEVTTADGWGARGGIVAVSQQPGFFSGGIWDIWEIACRVRKTFPWQLEQLENTLNYKLKKNVVLKIFMFGK